MSQRLDLADAQWRRVSPKQIAVEVLGSAIVVIVAGGAAVTFFMLGLGIPALVLGVISLVSLITALFVPRRVRSYGYLLRDDDLLFRRGLLFQRFVAVPYGRMQLVDITRGPIARIMGLADLKLVTAASTSGVAIPGLTEPDAAALRDRLVELAETRRVGL